MDTVTRRYTFKLYPTKAQSEILHEQRKLMADLWNALKQRREDVYRRERRSLTYFDLTNEITQMRHECPEWAEIPAVTAHRVAKWLTDAYQAFFRRLRNGETPGYPQWQKRDSATTIPLGTMDKTGWRIEQRKDNPFSWRLHYKSLTNVKDKSTWGHARGRLPARPIDQRWDFFSRIGDVDGLSLRSIRAMNPIPVTAWRNADFIWHDDTWWLSVCVDIESRRAANPGQFPIVIRFDLLDEFARVNGIAETPAELLDALALDAEADRLKSERDIAFPRGKRFDDGERVRFMNANKEIASLLALIARKRRNAIHVWTSRIVERASDLTIIAPPVREATKTPRGDSRNWGANVEPVAALNRHVLSQAPMTAVQMLKYKAEEAGIRCDIVKDDTPKIAVGGELVTAGKQLRRARRETKRKAA